MELQQGGNAAIGSAPLRVSVELDAPAGVEVDVSAYLLGEDGRVRGDHDMVFYNQPKGGGGAVRLADRTGGASFDVDPGRLPEAIARIVFCVTIDGAGQTVARLNGARIVVRRGDDVVARFAPVLAGASEAAMIFGELYRRGGAWKLRAVGQGFDGGLAPLARSFGIVVDEGSAAPPPPPAPAAASSVNLSKISLDKPGQSVNLGKKGQTLGEIRANLTWSKDATMAAGIDLDLACLWELRNGEKLVTQALGNYYGSYDTKPFNQLDRDDREGDGSQGETIRINGAHSREIKRILIFAYIYSGVPNWAATNGVVTITVPGQPEIEVRLTDGRDDARHCGIVMIEGDGDTVKVTRIVQYYPSVHALDAAFAWGIPWGAPQSKD